MLDLSAVPIEPFYQRNGMTIYNADCRDVLPYLPKFDLLLTDPPYGIGADNRKRNLSRSCLAAASDFGDSDWDHSCIEVGLISLARECADWQIIFGGNFYSLPPSPCWLVWDKDNGENDFADCELAWTNLRKAVRKFKWRWQGMLQELGGSKKEFRRHPTQKPVPLIKWCLSLVPAAQAVLDPFMGSGTTLEAAQLAGIEAVGIELEPRYCESAVKRLAQQTLSFADDLGPQ